MQYYMKVISKHVRVNKTIKYTFINAPLIELLSGHAKILLISYIFLKYHICAYIVVWVQANGCLSSFLGVAFMGPAISVDLCVNTKRMSVYN